MQFLHLFLILLSISTFTLSRKIKTTPAQVPDIITIDVNIKTSNYYHTCELHKADLENPIGDKREKLFFYQCNGSQTTSFWKTAGKEAEKTLSLEYRYLSTFTTPINWWENTFADYTYPTKGTLSFYLTGPWGEQTRAKVIGWLNTNIQIAKGAMNALKDNALTAAVNYSTSKQSNAAALKGLEGIKAQIPSFETSLNTLATVLTNKDAQIADFGKQIADETAKLVALQTQQSKCASERQATEDEIKKTKTDQATLQAQLTNGTADAEATKTALNDAKVKWDSAYISLKTNFIGQEKTVDTANTELITNNNLEKAKTAIISVN
jgi:hypothetical protein